MTAPAARPCPVDAALGPLPGRWRGLATAVATAAALATLSGCAALKPAAGGKPEAGAAGAPGAAAPTPPATPAPPAAGASGPGRPPVAGRPGPAATAAAAASAPTTATAPAAPPSPLPPFATVIKDAKSTTGLFTFWQKDEKLWLELKPEDFDKPFFLSPKLASGLGEGGVYAGMMLPGPRLVQWRRQHNLVQLVAVNTVQTAQAGTPEARAVAQATSPSLLSATPVASAPNLQSKAILVDGAPFFLGDIPQVSGLLQRAFSRGYGLERGNSTVTALRGTYDLSVVEVRNHYVSGAPTPNPLAALIPGLMPSAPSGPFGVPDPRSILVGVHYSLARLPEQPMAARKADQRVGYFLSSSDDFSNDLSRSPRQRIVHRWRLEKKDPAAELSEPVKPITYWIDRTVPLKYRDTIRDGILEWNKAFERIGFKDAVVVKTVPDEDGDVHILDAGVASVRWLVSRSAAFGAIGPSHVDPRTGEILDADIAIESLSSRNVRAARVGILGPANPASTALAFGPYGGLAGLPADQAQAVAREVGREWAALLQVPAPGGASAAAQRQDTHRHDASCQHADLASEQLGLALEVLEARGELDPDSPEAQQFVQAYLKDVTMHEVGHTLGLRHNFRASHVYSDRQVRDPVLSRSQAFTGSVMDYTPINLPRPGEPAAAPFSSTLGPYDFWAIEYAYKPIAPADEAAELARIAGRSGEPELAFATDEDNFLGIDPDALQMDLGDDPVAFAARRFDIAADLYRRQESRQLAPGEDYARLRRGLLYATRDAARATGILIRQIGGMRTLRDLANTGRDPLQPVAAATQRAAMALIAQRVLAPTSFVISSGLQRKLAPDYLERAEGVSGMGTEFSLSDGVLGLQRAVLMQLMSDMLARRMLDNQAMAAPRSDVFTLAELYEVLDETIWRAPMAKTADPVAQQTQAAARRNLQREHTNLLAILLTRPMILGRADARGLLRGHAQQLLARLQQQLPRSAPNSDERRHLLDSSDTLRMALAAQMPRATP